MMKLCEKGLGTMFRKVDESSFAEITVYRNIYVKKKKKKSRIGNVIEHKIQSARLEQTGEIAEIQILK